MKFIAKVKALKPSKPKKKSKDDLVDDWLTNGGKYPDTALGHLPDEDEDYKWD